MKKILVAYDGGEPGRRALETTIELAKGIGAKVGVISVVPFHPGRIPIDPWDDQEVHKKELEEAQGFLADAGINADCIELGGDPARAIEKVVEERQYDMVVLGSRGLGALSRFLQGSVSENVATHAKATVVIAR